MSPTQPSQIKVGADGSGARTPLLALVLVVLVRRRSPLAPTLTTRNNWASLSMLQNACFKCFVCFIWMLQK
jgi:hypothetical protein